MRNVLVFIGRQEEGGGKGTWINRDGCLQDVSCLSVMGEMRQGIV